MREIYEELRDNDAVTKMSQAFCALRIRKEFRDIPKIKNSVAIPEEYVNTIIDIYHVNEFLDKSDEERYDLRDRIICFFEMLKETRNYDVDLDSMKRNVSNGLNVGVNTYEEDKCIAQNKRYWDIEFIKLLKRMRSIYYTEQSLAFGPNGELDIEKLNDANEEIRKGFISIESVVKAWQEDMWGRMEQMIQERAEGEEEGEEEGGEEDEEEDEDPADEEADGEEKSDKIEHFIYFAKTYMSSEKSMFAERIDQVISSYEEKREREKEAGSQYENLKANFKWYLCNELLPYEELNDQSDACMDVLDEIWEDSKREIGDLYFTWLEARFYKRIYEHERSSLPQKLNNNKMSGRKAQNLQTTIDKLAEIQEEIIEFLKKEYESEMRCSVDDIDSKVDLGDLI